MKDAPQRGEVHELWGELVGRKLGRRFFHHLLQLLEGRAPRVVREAQDGELDLRRGKREREKKKEVIGTGGGHQLHGQRSLWLAITSPAVTVSTLWIQFLHPNKWNEEWRVTKHLRLSFSFQPVDHHHSIHPQIFRY